MKHASGCVCGGRGGAQQYRDTPMGLIPSCQPEPAASYFTSRKHSRSCTEEGTAFLKSLVPVVEWVREHVLLRLPPAPPHHLPAFDWSHRHSWPRTGHRNGTSNSVCLPSAASWANCEQNSPVWCSLVESTCLAYGRSWGPSLARHTQPCTLQLMPSSCAPFCTTVRLSVLEAKVMS